MKMFWNNVLSYSNSKNSVTYSHWKILLLAGIWTLDLPCTKSICYQLFLSFLSATVCRDINIRFILTINFKPWYFESASWGWLYCGDPKTGHSNAGHFGRPVLKWSTIWQPDKIIRFSNAIRKPIRRFDYFQTFVNAKILS